MSTNDPTLSSSETPSRAWLPTLLFALLVVYASAVLMTHVRFGASSFVERSASLAHRLVSYPVRSFGLPAVWLAIVFLGIVAVRHSLQKKMGRVPAGVIGILLVLLGVAGIAGVLTDSPTADDGALAWSGVCGSYLARGLLVLGSPIAFVLSAALMAFGFIVGREWFLLDKIREWTRRSSGAEAFGVGMDATDPIPNTATGVVEEAPELPRVEIDEEAPKKGRSKSKPKSKDDAGESAGLMLDGLPSLQTSGATPTVIDALPSAPANVEIESRSPDTGAAPRSLVDSLLEDNGSAAVDSRMAVHTVDPELATPKEDFDFVVPPRVGDEVKAAATPTPQAPRIGEVVAQARSSENDAKRDADVDSGYHSPSAPEIAAAMAAVAAPITPSETKDEERADTVAPSNDEGEGGRVVAERASESEASDDAVVTEIPTVDLEASDDNFDMGFFEPDLNVEPGVAVDLDDLGFREEDKSASDSAAAGIIDPELDFGPLLEDVEDVAPPKDSDSDRGAEDSLIATAMGEEAGAVTAVEDVEGLEDDDVEAELEIAAIDEEDVEASDDEVEWIDDDEEAEDEDEFDAEIDDYEEADEDKEPDGDDSAVIEEYDELDEAEELEDDDEGYVAEDEEVEFEDDLEEDAEEDAEENVAVEFAREGAEEVEADEFELVADNFVSSTEEEPEAATSLDDDTTAVAAGSLTEETGDLFGTDVDKSTNESSATTTDADATVEINDPADAPELDLVAVDDTADEPGATRRTDDDWATWMDDRSAVGAKSGPSADGSGGYAYDDAVRVVFARQKCSVSLLQRELGMTFADAAAAIESMERDGIVGPYRGSGSREILVTEPEWSARSTPGGGTES